MRNFNPFIQFKFFFCVKYLVKRVDIAVTEAVVHLGVDTQVSASKI